jgi:alpha-tubulin suppressor-like RCC1 family protein
MRAHTLRLWLIAFLTVGIASWWQLPTVAQAPAPEGKVLYAAGDSLTGKLGILSANISPPRLFPSPAAPFDDVIDAALGENHTLVLRSDGSVWSIGSNNFGQLGLSNPPPGLQPLRVDNIPPIVNVVAGDNHSLALDNTGAVWAWGADSSGQLGIGGNNTPQPVPVMIPTLSNVVDIAAGLDFSLAVDSDGIIWAWGNNSFLQLGDAGPAANQPIVVPKGVGFFATHVAAGGRTAYALSNNGQVMAWGFNGNQQISADVAQAVPSAAPIISNIRSMAVGDSHVLLVRNDGTVAARGLGSNGQLGLGNASSSSVFVTVPGLTNVRDVAAGAAHSAAVLNDGSIWTWGLNNRSQLGVTVSSSVTSPTKLQGLPATGRSVVAAASSTLFLNAPGALGVDIQAPGNVSCSEPFTTQLSLTGYDVFGVTPNDMVLVLDESGSIGAANFNLLKQFAHNFVNAQTIGPDANRVAVVLFDNNVRTIISLSSNKAQLLTAIDGIVYGSGPATCIGCGIQVADQILDSQGRLTANRMMVVVTDGANNVTNPDFETVVLDAQQTSTLFAIGVGSQVSVDQINFIASDVPHVKTALFTTDFAGLTLIIANLSVDLGPAYTNVHVTLDLNDAFVQNGAASVTSGNVSSSAGLVTWTLPTLGSTTVTLNMPQRGAGQGGVLPLFDAIHYNVGHGDVAVPVPTTIVVGCPVSLSLNPPSATQTTGQLHHVSFAALDENGGVANVPVMFSVTSGPNAGLQFNATPNGVPAEFNFTSVQPGTDTLQVSALGYAIPPATATVEWVPPNRAPSANAGPDRVVELSGAPTATFTLHGSANDDGQPQALSFEWLEGGVSVGNAPSLTLTRGLGSYHFTLQAFDGELSGNDSAHVAVIDPTPPLVAPTVSGAQGINGWYTGPVTVTWKVVDHESTIESPACPNALLKDDGANLIATCFAESAGGKTNASTSVNIDNTPPDVTVPADLVVPAIDTLTPVLYSGESATDATSGVVSFGCVPASGSSFPLGETVVTCSATDGAGNSASDTFTVTVTDSTPPVITSDVVGTSTNGWYTGNVVVSWTVTDPDGPVTQTGCDSTTITTDGANILLTCTAESAGGSKSKTVSISRDATAPSLTTSPNLSVSATSPTGATVNYAAAAASDPTSGVAFVSCAPPSGFFLLGTTTVICTATDNAGNTSSGSFTITVRDTAPPVITTTTPSVTSLSPPNHQMVPITISVSAADNLGAAPVCVITGVTSNEPQNGLGDGDTPNDWMISGPLTLQLRAERSGKGDGRAYTIAVRCADAAGNAATSSATVVVQKGKK